MPQLPGVPAGQSKYQTSSLSVKYLVPQGTYLTWLDISAYQPDSEKFAKDCGRGGIIVEQGDVFGEGGKGFIRFNVGTPKANIAEGLARMKKVIEVY